MSMHALRYSLIILLFGLGAVLFLKGAQHTGALCPKPHVADGVTPSQFAAAQIQCSFQKKCVASVTTTSAECH